MPSIEYVDTVAWAAVNICWVSFLLPFLFRKRPPADARDQRRDRMSMVGFVMQAIAYAIIWGTRRPDASGFVPAGYWVRAAFDVAAILSGAWAIWFVVAGVIVLGKQWSLSARVLEGHELATTGPYAIVRHPIYTAMVLMALATGIVVTDWRWTIAAVALSIAGAAPMFFVDEPGLYAFSRNQPGHIVMLQELRILIMALKKRGARVGLHCCSDADWGALMGLGLDLLGIDARLSLRSLLQAGEALVTFVSMGGRFTLPTAGTMGNYMFRCAGGTLMRDVVARFVH